MKLAETGTPALHAVHTERLQDIMRDLNQLAFEHLPQELDANSERAKRLRDAAQVAGKIAETARILPCVVSDEEMSASERELFDRLAEKLGSEARTLSAEAARGSYSKVKASLERVTATCNACHTEFRGLSPIEV